MNGKNLQVLQNNIKIFNKEVVDFKKFTFIIYYSDKNEKLFIYLLDCNLLNKNLIEKFICRPVMPNPLLF